MKCELFHTMSEQMVPDERVVNELLMKIRRAEKPVQNRKWIIGAAAAAACVAIGIPSAILVPKIWGPTPGNSIAGNSEEPTKNIALITGWNERSYPSKYDSMTIDGELFSSTLGEIDKDQLGEFLFETTLIGYDYTDPNYYIDREKAKEYKINADVYAVKGVNQRYIVAAQYEGQDGFYTYIPNGYVPETLGEFVNNLNLKETLTIDTILYESEKDGRKITTEYALPDYSVFWDLLAENASAKYEDPNELKKFGGELGIQVSMDIAAETEKHIGISKNGYLYTNIYHTGKAFYIGEDNTTAFINYVLASGSGKEVTK